MRFLHSLFLSLFVMASLSGVVYAQWISSLRVSGNASQENKRRSDQKALISDQEAVKAIYKDQAVQVLRDELNSSSSIEDIGQRSVLISRAAELLWPYDPELAHRSVSNTLDYLLEQYKEPAVKNSSERLGRLNVAVNRLVKTLARRDPVGADAALQRVKKTKGEALKGISADPSANERLSLAQESLGSDVNRSIELAGRVIETGVPWGFPQYLYDLEQIDAPGARALYDRALSRLASSPTYSATDAIQLSTYAFSERMMLLPVPDLDQESHKLQFGVFTKSLSAPKGAVIKSTATNAYLSAAHHYITRQLEPGSLRGADPVHLVQSLFLATKLSVYSTRLGLRQRVSWQQLKFDLEVRCRNAGVDDATVQNINGYAVRLANTEDVFQFGDDSLFDRAKDTKDRGERDKLLVRGIWSLIQGKRFDEAESKIKELDDNEVRERLRDLLEYYAAKASLKGLDQIELSRRSKRISDPRIRLLLFLESANGLSEEHIASQFLLDARSLIPKLSSKTDRAKGLISLASLSAVNHPQFCREILSEIAKAINAADDFDGGDFQVEVAIMSDFRVMLSIPDSNLDTCLKRAAKVDWRNTLSLTEDLNSKVLKALARVSTCAAVL